ncbi:MAG TPA: hypothetical protein VMV15_12655 [Candidatus Binataceae bacterium]|nr:hypothetical protein [Candidatus Binataceae bacterium]
MGLFDVPAPLFALVGAWLNPLLPDSARIALWGGVVGGLATTIYWLLSPQQRIVEIRARARVVRNALLRYDGEFRGVLTLTGESLALSLKELSLVIGPALAASIPALCLIAYLGNSYDYYLPSAGTMVSVRVKPADAAVHWSPPSVLDPEGGVFRIQWPQSGHAIQLMSSRGGTLASFPLRKPIPNIQKFVWWNFLFGNPAGYVPASAEVSSIELKLTPREFLSVGPGWLRGWETIFFFFASITALTFRKLLVVQ